MDRASKKEDLTMGFEARVSYSLEECLSLRQERIVVQVVTDSAIPREDLFLLWNFIEGYELWVEIDLSKDRY